MRQLIMWASPLIGVILGLAGIMVFRQQLPAEAMMPDDPPLRVQQTRPDKAHPANAPTVERVDEHAGLSVAKKN